MDIPEKQTKHKNKENKTGHNVRWTPLYTNKQTLITQIKNEPSYKQLEVTKNRTSFLFCQLDS